MAIEINTTNNKASNLNFNDDLANLNLTENTVQEAIEDLDARIDVNEEEIQQLKNGNQIAALNDITDVTITSATTGQVLKYNGSYWVNDTVTGALALDDITDVTITTPANDELLAYDSTSGNFINKTASEAGLASATHTHSAGDITSGTFDAARISQSSVTQYESNINHDALTNFVANEHIDWTIDQGATNINDANITASSVTQHQAALSINKSQIPDFGTYLSDITTQPINNLSDVVITSPSNNQVIKYNGTNWVNATNPIGTLDDLSNVTVPSPAENNILAYTTSSGGFWYSTSLGSIASNQISLQALSNVADTTGTNGDFLIYNGSSWVMRVPNLVELNDVQGTPTNNQVLTYNSTTSQWEPKTPSSGGSVTASGITVNNTNFSVLTSTNGQVVFDEIDDALLANTGSLKAANNLSDLNNTTTALTNLGFTSTITELNYTDGVTSSIQTQLDGKASTTHTHSATDITSGTFANARIAQSNVTQHQAALSLTKSQITDFGTYLTDITTQPLNNLSDVIITTPSTNQLLQYNGTNWVNNTPSYLTNINGQNLADLNDVSNTTPTNGQVLTYATASSSWVPSTPSGGGGSSFSGCKLSFRPTGRTQSSNDSFSHTVPISWGAGANIIYNYDNYYSVSFGTRLTVPTNGIYQISGIVNMVDSAGSSFRIQLHRNGTLENYLVSSDVEAGLVTSDTLSYCTSVYAVLGDYFEIVAYLRTSSSTGDLTIQTQTEVCIHRLYEVTI